jgi:hypothetical protein
MPDTFNGYEGSEIGLQDASALTETYRNGNPGATKGHFIGRERIMELLDQEGAMGIRVYYGIDKYGAKQLVFCAAEANKDDMLDLIMDFSIPCPTMCGSANALNSTPE